MRNHNIEYVYNIVKKVLILWAKNVTNSMQMYVNFLLKQKNWMICSVSK